MSNDYPRRVVITGLGMVTPVGIGIKDAWPALLSGRSGVAPITKFDASNYKTKIAAEVKGFHPEDFMDKKQIRRLELFIQYAVASSRMALDDSGLVIGENESLKIGCHLGCGLGGLQSMEDNHGILLKNQVDRISPFFIPMMIGNMAAGQVAIELGLKGPNYLSATACSAGTHAVGMSYHLIRNGGCKTMITGGTESVITPLAVAGFNAIKALSTRNDEPEKASRPFDCDRDGFVIGEGSGILVMEELTQAQERGAHIYAEIVGFGASCDAYHITAPREDGDGAARAMQAALADIPPIFGLGADHVDYINAHGTSTGLNDLMETRAIKKFFGERAAKIPVSSTKSMTGHLLGAAGGLEAAIVCMALHDGNLPPTINLDNPEPECDLDYIPNKSRKASIHLAMSNSFGFGGTNGVIILKTIS